MQQARSTIREEVNAASQVATREEMPIKSSHLLYCLQELPHRNS